jgi:hypothetical protein
MPLNLGNFCHPCQYHITIAANDILQESGSRVYPLMRRGNRTQQFPVLLKSTMSVGELFESTSFTLAGD